MLKQINIEDIHGDARYHVSYRAILHEFLDSTHEAAEAALDGGKAGAKPSFTLSI